MKELVFNAKEPFARARARAMASGFMCSSDAGQAAGDKVSEAKGARAVMLTADLLEDVHFV